MNGQVIPQHDSRDYGGNLAHMLGFEDPQMLEVMRLCSLSLSLRRVLLAASLLILFLEWLGGGFVEGFYFCSRVRL